MSISDGQSVNAAVTNAAFVSKTVDSSMSGKLNVTNTSDATGITDGAIHTDGGMGVEKSLHVGTTANVTGNINAGANVVVTGDVSAVNGTFTGDVDAVNSVLSGDITAVNVNGTTVTTTNLFSGTSSLGTATANSLGVDTITTTGNVVVGGDLTVSGTTTTLNTATLEVTDANIVVNNGGSDATAEGAGLTVERTGTAGSLVYEDALASKFKIGAAGSEAEVVSVSASQTLTNKTIDSDNNTITNIVNADIKAAAAIALDKLAATTASRALVSDASGFVSASSVTDTELGYVSGVTSSIQTQLNAKATDSGVVHLAGSETITGVKTLDTELVSKHIATPSNPSSGYMKIYPKSDDKFYTLTSAGVESELGSGSGGSGSKNYFPTAVASGQLTTGFNQYADAAGVSPVDGTGGSPSGQLTITSSASSPLSGTNSLVITKDANNRQGEGVSIDFTLDDSDKGKVLAFSMNYAPSTNYADDYMSVWFYDATNGVLLQPAPYKIKKHTLVSDKFFCEVQTPYNCSTLRMIFHCATSTTTAWTMKIDDLLYGPQAKLYGSAVTDWVSYTPTLSGGFSNGNSNATISARYKRVGDSIEIEGKITVGSSNTFAASPLTISLPSGLSFDTSKIGMDLGQAPIGFAQINDTSFGGGFKAFIARQSTTAFTVQVPFNNAFSGTTFERMDGNSYATSTYPFTWANGDSINFKIESAPILGWSSSQIMSSDASTRVVAARAYRASSGQTLTASGSDIKIQFNGKTSDTYSSFDATTNYRYTVSTPGFYNISGTLIFPANTSDELYAFLYKNGVPYRDLGHIVINATYPSTLKYGATDNAVAGDYYEIYINNSNTTQTLSSDASVYGGSDFNISMLQGPAQIAASETVASRHTTNAGLSIPHASQTTVVFEDKDFDYTGSYNTSTGVFTAPISGLYSIKAKVLLIQGGGWTAGEYAHINILKNSSTYSIAFKFAESTHGTFVPLITADEVRLLAGETISIAVYQNSGAALTLNTGGGENTLAITRVGNY